MIRSMTTVLMALFVTAPALASVVCTQNAMGTVQIQKQNGACLVTWYSPEKMIFQTLDSKCTEVYDGEKYTLHTVLATESSPAQPTMTIVRGTSTDVRAVTLTVNEYISMKWTENLKCEYK